MSKYILSVLLILCSIGIIVIGSCSKDDEITISDFEVFVDSIKAPDTIALGEAFEAEFYGFLGETDCYLFQSFNVDMPKNTISVSVIGGYTEDQECDSIQQFLSGEILRIVDLPAGDYIFKVNQPRDIPIETALYVGE